VSKFVAKFRKDRDYNDDYNFSQRKKSSNRRDPTRKLINYNYDEMLQNSVDESITRKKVRRLV
jgi:hypothetical protein